MTAKTAAKGEAKSPIIKVKMSKHAKRFRVALDLLERAANRLSDDRAPDSEWWRDYFLLTGQHMILTDEGWCDGSAKELEEPASILDEVNAPEAIHG